MKLETEPPVLRALNGQRGEDHAKTCPTNPASGAQCGSVDQEERSFRRKTFRSTVLG